MTEHNTLEGVLERIVYFNEENNFTVARLNAGNSRDLVTIVGNLPGPNPGETFRLKGEWIVDPNSGVSSGWKAVFQFCLRLLPELKSISGLVW